jgi:phosphatidylglycerophosphate synthase
MVSKFGDYYDHISDWSYFFALFVIALMNGLNLSTWLHVCVLILVLVFACSASLHMACQEQIYSLSNPESCEGPSLRFLTLIAKQIGDPKTMIRYTRYGGNNCIFVFNLYFYLFIFLFQVLACSLFQQLCLAFLSFNKN